MECNGAIGSEAHSKLHCCINATTRMVEVAGVGIRGSGAKWVKSLASMLIVDRTLMVFSAWS